MSFLGIYSLVFIVETDRRDDTAACRQRRAEPLCLEHRRGRPQGSKRRRTPQDQGLDPLKGQSGQRAMTDDG